MGKPLSSLMVRRRVSAVSNHEARWWPHPSRRDEDAAPQDEGQAIRSSIVSDLNFKELAATAPRSRGAFRPSCARNLPPSPIRGRRECRAPDAPAAACAVVESTRVSHHGHTGNTRHSPRNGFTAYFALSPVTGLSCHCRRRSCLRQLDASVGASGPHDFAVRLKRIRQSAIRVHRIPPSVRDDREPPLLSRRDGRGCIADLGRR